jgi:hypothetical protein
MLSTRNRGILSLQILSSLCLTSYYKAINIDKNNHRGPTNEQQVYVLHFSMLSLLVLSIKRNIWAPALLFCVTSLLCLTSYYKAINIDKNNQRDPKNEQQFYFLHFNMLRSLQLLDF